MTIIQNNKICVTQDFKAVIVDNSDFNEHPIVILKIAMGCFETCVEDFIERKVEI